MYMSADTLLALHIFPESAFSKGKLHAAEQKDHSLFNLMNFTCTPQGYTDLKSLFLRPTTNLDIISNRQNFIEIFSSPRNNSFLLRMRKELKGVKNMQRSITLLRMGKSSLVNVTEWRVLVKFCNNVSRLKTLSMELNLIHSHEILKDLNNIIDIPSLRVVSEDIMSIVDFDESILEQRSVVNPHVDGDLDEMKRIYDGLSGILAEVAADMSSRMPTFLANSLNIIYFPQLGYLAVIPAVDEGQMEYSNHEWEKRFSTASSLYYKTPEMLRLDEEIGDIHTDIVNREIEIVLKLQERVLEYERIFVESSIVCGHLDSLLSLAMAACKYKYIRPTVVEQNVCHIEGARHAIKEQLISSYISNDISLFGGNENKTDETISEAQTSALILTGANYSGKSVFIKSIAIIVYLSHIGSFVPATKGTIGVTDKILTRITTRESSSKMSSAFLIDAQQINYAISYATKRSLIVIDEFGKGTDPYDGPSLFGAVVEHFCSPESQRPRSLFATHFHEITCGGLLKSPLSYQIYHMDCIIQENNDIRDIVYLYKLQKGAAKYSYGLLCAQNAGLPPDVLQRASIFLEILHKGSGINEVICPLTNSEKQRILKAENVARRFMSADFSGEQINPLDILQNILSSN